MKKILLVNFFLLLIALLSVEFLFRLLTFFITCKTTCDLSLLTLNPYQDSLYLGFTQKDNFLGYEPRKNFSKVINVRNWPNVIVSTDSYGLRNTVKTNNSKERVLTVGDSFTFGDQVSNEDTWQACLNKKFGNKTFLNGGVFGYGTAQALLRAEKLYPQVEPDYLLVQTTVGGNFDRDRLSIRSGFPKPYISLNPNNTLRVVPPKSFDIENTKFSNKKSISFMDHLIINFTHFRKLPYVRRFYNHSYSKATSNIAELGEKYASIEQIIKWTLKKSKLLDENVVYLLQYSHYLTDEVLDERKLLIEILNQSNIRFIDTFDYLHGDLKPTSLRPIPDIWFSHHTPLGNKIVCKAILESGIYNE